MEIPKNLRMSMLQSLGANQGIPHSNTMAFLLSNNNWIMIEERFQKKLFSWKGKLFSTGGRLVLINY
jgi:hypothetical protein